MLGAAASKDVDVSSGRVEVGSDCTTDTGAFATAATVLVMAGSCTLSLATLLLLLLLASPLRSTMASTAQLE